MLARTGGLVCFMRFTEKKATDVTDRKRKETARIELMRTERISGTCNQEERGQFELNSKLRSLQVIVSHPLNLVQIGYMVEGNKHANKRSD